ncbi:MAG: hypothetical protein EPN25_11790 [Nitrospirae bacterium]|nr:MAG: hypothetical protein EPN25_11790 [Nitrospirota bacterium]
MALAKASERDKNLLTLLKQWKGLEDITIKSCSSILKKSTNPIIQTLTNAIRNDSEKHKAIIQLVIDSMTKKAIVLTSEDLADVASLLDKHIGIEQKAIDMAEEAIELSRDAIVVQMLKLILEDEKKHKKMAKQMNELKFRITAKIT